MRRILCGFIVAILLVAQLALGTDGALAAPSESSPSASPTVHVVARGETLYSIARRYGTTVTAIMQANGISNPNRLYAGQRLIIPTPGAPAVSSGGSRIHVVSRGQTLYSIARAYGTTISAIMQVNGLTNRNWIYSGQRLVIPTQGTAATSSGSPAVHIVARGQNLQSIANRYGTSVSAIMRANGLRNANLIYVGQRLTIPGRGREANSSPRVHVVRRGETLYQIAVRYGVSMTAIVQANGLRSANRIYAGQRLTIPASGQGSGASSTPASAPSASPTAAPASPPSPPKSTASGKKWIDVNISTQTLTAYQGQTSVYTARVSTGVARYPTVTGRFAIYHKLRSQTMRGPGYYLPNVPHVMYFYRGYALHGTYWHNNFGRPMSHGCINLSKADAKWLFDWSSLGTPVVTHY
ncbi:MAG: LysM peptidoglycan-binding domain-containing protein [Anaerolineae bacterium]